MTTIADSISTEQRSRLQRAPHSRSQPRPKPRPKPRRKMHAQTPPRLTKQEREEREALEAARLALARYVAEDGWQLRTGKGSNKVLVAERGGAALYGSGSAPEVALAELLRWRTEAFEKAELARAEWARKRVAHTRSAREAQIGENDDVQQES